MTFIQYSTLFEVKFFHGYYGLNTSKDFEIVVSPQTQHYLSQFGLMYRMTPEGIIVLCKADKVKVLAEHRELLKFSFSVKLKNRFFGNFTDLNYELSREKYFFSNKFVDHQVSERQNSNGTKLLIHAGNYVAAADLRLFSLGTENLVELLGEKGIKLTSSDGQELFSGELEGHESLAQFMEAPFEDCELSMTNSGKSVGISHIPNEYRSSFAIIDIFLGGSSNISLDELKGSLFEVRFPNRSVELNYFFVSERKKQLSSISLFAGNEALELESTEEVILPNGQSATKVKLARLLQLKSRYDGPHYSAEFEESNSNLSSGSGSKRLTLPTPEISRVKGKRHNGEEIYYAEMYVYV